MIKLEISRKGAYPGLSEWNLNAITHTYKRKEEGVGDRHTRKKIYSEKKAM